MTRQLSPAKWLKRENPLHIMSAYEGLRARRRLNQSISNLCAEESPNFKLANSHAFLSLRIENEITL